MENINLTRFYSSIENMRRNVVAMHGAVEGISKVSAKEAFAELSFSDEKPKIISIANHLEKE